MKLTSFDLLQFNSYSRPNVNIFFSGLENPTVVVGIIFVSLFSIFSIMDCLMGKEGKNFPLSLKQVNHLQAILEPFLVENR